MILKCTFESQPSTRVVAGLLTGLVVSYMFLSQSIQVLAESLCQQYNLRQLVVVAENDKIPIDEDPDDGRGKLMMMMMMRGMTAKNFDPIRYSGRWFEVASVKRGFAGQGQEDCDCT